MRPPRHIGAILVVCLLLVAGCASDAGETGPTTQLGTETSATTGTTTPTADADATTTATATSSPTAETLEVHFINVGQSAAILLVAPSNETMLIDTGDWRDDGEEVIQYLEARDITRIDHLVTTHADADHIGGHAAVIETFETQYEGVGAVYDPGIAASSQTYEAYLDAVEQYDVPLYRASAGDAIPFAGVSTTVLAPPTEYLANEARNENSLSLRVQHGEHSFLFTGDGEEALEEYLLEHHRDQLNVTVFKTGHHGSRTSSSAALLDAVTPRVAVVSSAYDSQYGHPHVEVLQRLAARNVLAYWTATHGTIRFVTDGDTMTVATVAAAPTQPLDIRDADAVAPGTFGPFTIRQTITTASSSDGQPVTETPVPVTSATTSASSPTAAGQLVVADVHADAAGTESENLNDEYVVFENTGDEPIDVSGWTIRDNAGHVYTVPEGVTLAVGATLTLHTGSGTDTDSDLYWGSGSAVWNNGGDTVIVRTADGTTVVEESY